MNWKVSRKVYNKTGKTIISVDKTDLAPSKSGSKCTQDYFYSYYFYKTKKAAEQEAKRLKNLK